jgi:uncharacterized protein YabN with tetrapyrrole methylase and pyrophosphatase domain
MTECVIKKALASQINAVDRGFDWDNCEQVINKIYEEIKEVAHEINNDDHLRLAEEMGDLLLAVLNLFRKCKLDAVSCLDDAIKKFDNRFEKMLNLAVTKKMHFDSLSLEQKEILWQAIKK